MQGRVALETGRVPPEETQRDHVHIEPGGIQPLDEIRNYPFESPRLQVEDDMDDTQSSIAVFGHARKDRTPRRGKPPATAGDAGATGADASGSRTVYASAPALIADSRYTGSMYANDRNVPLTAKPINETGR